MKTENELLKAQYITSINSLKYDAIRLGFDYPTQPIENESLSTIIAFHREILTYIMDNWDNYSGDYSEVKIQ